jgi:hypothetical protein
MWKTAVTKRVNLGEAATLSAATFTILLNGFIKGKITF